MSKNIYYENKFYRDSVDWSTYVDVIASSVRDIKNIAKRQMCMVIGGRRSSLEMRSVHLQSWRGTIALSIPLSGLETSVRLSFLTLILMSLRWQYSIVSPSRDSSTDRIHKLFIESKRRKEEKNQMGRYIEKEKKIVRRKMHVFRA